MFNEPSEDSRPAGGRGLEETRALIGKKKEGSGEMVALRAMALWRRRGMRCVASVGRGPRREGCGYGVRGRGGRASR